MLEPQMSVVGLGNRCLAVLLHTRVLNEDAGAERRGGPGKSSGAAGLLDHWLARSAIALPSHLIAEASEAAASRVPAGPVICKTK